MLKRNITILLILISGVKLFAQKLILDGGIYVEKPDYSSTEKHRYSNDNISYKRKMTFIFDYYYIDNSGVKKKFLLSKNEATIGNPLNLVDYQNSTDSTIDKIKLVITDSVETFPNYDSTYTQTVMSYAYIVKNKKVSDSLCECFEKRGEANRQFLCSGVSTGVIDNYKNLWMHPPRQFTFKILQLNPFPFYYLDESVNHWSWELETGGAYLDPRWINSKEKVKINYDYVRQNDETINSPLGKIKCKVTNGTGTSEFGNTTMKTYLKSYYHPKYGFVRLEYININGTKIVIQLTDIES
ncbi:hypothetical protein SAMN05518672_102185 [Chitinophaga sp. CF118]|uniref:hypothetical protein n=1 Tax=Chitinophaga sp. CF118 TaxID=1884367 RepID=UPI0008E02EBE|nr:hypothetical protein [Chitinophaga sp. CF118]SFD49806.1 hypothetical protein SAMN05518672_102185 [Chitinophaga sp. CF118]